MKTRNVILVFVLASLLFGCGVKESNNGENANSNSENADIQKLDLPLNISVYLDLSDRILRDLTPSQKERDLAIVGCIADYFKERTIGSGILQSKNNMKVFFYPRPKISDIASRADSLCIDITKYNGVDKRIVLEGDPKHGKPSLKERFEKTLSVIYDKTIAENQYPGCDIWDFFSSKQVDTQCMKVGFRNILVILTDGYLFDENHKVQHGADSLSWVTPASLKNPNTALIVNRKGLEGLEVRILEVNPVDINHRDHLVAVLENWLKGMGVKDENITIAQTDLPSDTRIVISDFLK